MNATKQVNTEKSEQKRCHQIEPRRTKSKRRNRHNTKISRKKTQGLKRKKREKERGRKRERKEDKTLADQLKKRSKVETGQGQKRIFGQLNPCCKGKIKTNQTLINN